MLDKLDQFVTVKEGDIILKMHRDEAAVLREYAMPLAQEALKTLSARYGFTPTGPILIEIFPKHDDFAVRNLGLPGMIGALGACFGRVVTMDSPTARQPGTFSWQATLWHELAHVDHAADVEAADPAVADRRDFGLRGDGPAPRVGTRHGESRSRARWTGARSSSCGSERGLHASRHHLARLLPSVAARRAHRRDEAGRRRSARWSARTPTGIDTDAALKRALNVDMDELQGSFDKALEDRFGAMRRALHDADKPVDAASLDALKAAAAAKPDNYIAQLALGQALAEAGDAVRRTRRCSAPRRWCHRRSATRARTR